MQTCMGKPDRGIHYMTDKRITSYMIEQAHLKPTDIVLDIGAGNGALTQEIDKHSHCIAVDIEPDHINHIEALHLKQTTILHKNIIETLPKLTFNKIVSNIPYSISEPLFYALSKKDFEFAIMTIGERFYRVISSDTKAGILIQARYTVTYLRSIPKSAFLPPPRAQSCLITLQKKKQLSKTDLLLQRVLRFDDKKIKNALDSLFEKKIPRRTISNLSKEHPFLEKKITMLSNKEIEQLIKILNKLNAQAGE